MTEWKLKRRRRKKNNSDIYSEICIAQYFENTAKYSVGVVLIKSRLLFVIRIECEYLHLLLYCFLFIFEIKLVFALVVVYDDNNDECNRAHEENKRKMSTNIMLESVFILSTRKMSAIKSIVRDFGSRTHSGQCYAMLVATYPLVITPNKMLRENPPHNIIIIFIMRLHAVYAIN